MNRPEGLLHLHQARLLHLEDAEFLGGAEAVLDGAEQPKAVAAVALQVEDRVHQMLQGHRAGNGALLGDVADDKDGGAGEFGRELGTRRKAVSRTWFREPGAEGDGGGVHGLDGIQGQVGRAGTSSTILRMFSRQVSVATSSSGDWRPPGGRPGA